MLAKKEEALSMVERAAEEGILFMGCGSTHYLAQFSARYFQRATGLSCQSSPSSEVFLNPDTLLREGQKPLAVALSRSGRTSETIQAVQEMRGRGSEALAISCYQDTGLASAASTTISIPEAQEKSFAQTGSFGAMLVAVQTLAALTANDDVLLQEIDSLPSQAEDLIARAKPMAKKVGANERYKRISYLGSGPLYGLANEGTIKMKEMSLSLAEAYHFMEFRHGPMSLLDEEHLVVGLVSERTQDYELAVLRDLRERGGSIVVIANENQGLSQAFDTVFALNSSLSERARPVLYLPFLQLMAYYRAMGRGLDPDRPRNVSMAIRLEGTEMKE
ncbi:MAG: SIS domain-containing protein [Chloroflexota bacterium]|nr:SIS domain-containing protein [Chloroflexota bacterium]